jgi:hypothetical protein
MSTVLAWLTLLKRNIKKVLLSWFSANPYTGTQENRPESALLAMLASSCQHIIEAFSHLVLCYAGLFAQAQVEETLQA